MIPEEVFARYERVRAEGRYNMVTEADAAAAEIGCGMGPTGRS